MNTSTAVERRGDWFETTTGKQFYILDPRAEDVDIWDVATALGRKARFNGHYRDEVSFYSVAEHCCLMTNYAINQRGASAYEALRVLLHDAAEAYTGDVVRPVKRSIPAFKEIEDLVERTVLPALGVPADMSPLTRELDERILRAERLQALKPSGFMWGNDDVEPLEVSLRFWSPNKARDIFHNLYIELLDGWKRGA